MPPVRPAPSPALLGMALGVAAYALFSFHDAAIKWVLTTTPTRIGLPVWEVLCIRSLFIVSAVTAIGRGRLLTRVVATPEKNRLLLRGVLLLAAWTSYYSAAASLPLAQLLTLYFAAPVITVILARPLLGEAIPPARWLSVAVGFAGVVVACDPGGVSFTWVSARVLMAACFWGVAIILMRQVSRREGTLLQMFYANLLFLIATGIACAVSSAVPTWGQAGALAIVCVLGACGQWCLFEGVRRAAASIMATVEYTALIWAFVLGWVVFGDVPRTPVWFGAALILLAGGLLVASERRAKIAARNPAVAEPTTR